MNRLRLFIFIIASSLLFASEMQARRHDLPADSVALMARFYDPETPLPDASTLFSYDKKNVWIHQLADCYARIPIRRQTTVGLNVVEGPEGAFRYKIRMESCPKDIKLTIRLRVEPGAAVCINGHPEAYTVKDGYAIFTRKWKRGTEILLQ